MTNFFRHNRENLKNFRLRQAFYLKFIFYRTVTYLLALDVKKIREEGGDGKFSTRGGYPEGEDEQEGGYGPPSANCAS